METRSKEIELFMRETRKNQTEASEQIESLKNELKKLTQSNEIQEKRMEARFEQMIQLLQSNQGSTGVTNPSKSPHTQVSGASSHTNRFVSQIHWDNQGMCSRLPKLEFFQFDGVNPRSWIRECERYFAFYDVLEKNKVALASIQLSGRPDSWISDYLVNKESLHWKPFVHALCDEFEGVILDDYVEAKPPIMYSTGGDLECARNVFDEMSIRDVKNPMEALDFFHGMLNLDDDDTVRPDKITIASAIFACVSLAANGQVLDLLPSQARLQKFTYSSQIKVKMKVHVICLRVILAEEHIKKLLRTKNFKEVVELVEELECEDEMTKEMFSFIHAQVGIFLLFELHFKETVNHFLQSEIMQSSKDNHLVEELETLLDESGHLRSLIFFYVSKGMSSKAIAIWCTLARQYSAGLWKDYEMENDIPGTFSNVISSQKTVTTKASKLIEVLCWILIGERQTALHGGGGSKVQNKRVVALSAILEARSHIRGAKPTQTFNIVGVAFVYVHGRSVEAVKNNSTDKTDARVGVRLVIARIKEEGWC